MLGLADIKDWIKTIEPAANHYYIGKLDNKHQKSIGVYQRQVSGPARIALGGLENTKDDTKQVSILIHWTKNARETEEAASALYEQLKTVTDVAINDTRVYFIVPEVPEPIDVGTDDDGVYERVIWLGFVYERK